MKTPRDIVAELAGTETQAASAAQSIGQVLGQRAREAAWPNAIAGALFEVAAALAGHVADKRDGAADELLRLLDNPLPKFEQSWSLEAMLRTLRDPSIGARVLAGNLLAASVGAGMRIAGLSELDAEHGAGRDLSNLIGKAIAGETAAADELERILTTDATKAGTTPTEQPQPMPIEPAAEIRNLARLHTPAELLDQAEAEPIGERRNELLGAVALASADRASSKEHRDALILALQACSRGDAAGFDRAREWITTNLIANRTEEPA